MLHLVYIYVALESYLGIIVQYDLFWRSWVAWVLCLKTEKEQDGEVDILALYQKKKAEQTWSLVYLSKEIWSHVSLVESYLTFQK
jgi:hypothetical protein